MSLLVTETFQFKLRTNNLLAAVNRRLEEVVAGVWRRSAAQRHERSRNREERVQQKRLEEDKRKNDEDKGFNELLGFIRSVLSAVGQSVNGSKRSS